MLTAQETRQKAHRRPLLLSRRRQCSPAEQQRQKVCVAVYVRLASSTPLQFHLQRMQPFLMQNIDHSLIPAENPGIQENRVLKRSASWMGTCAACRLLTKGLLGLGTSSSVLYLLGTKKPTDQPELSGSGWTRTGPVISICTVCGPISTVDATKAGKADNDTTTCLSFEVTGETGIE